VKRLKLSARSVTEVWRRSAPETHQRRRQNLSPEPVLGGVNLNTVPIRKPKSRTVDMPIEQRPPNQYQHRDRRGIHPDPASAASALFAPKYRARENLPGPIFVSLVASAL
jgi:hypothetical protein